MGVTLSGGEGGTRWGTFSNEFKPFIKSHCQRGSCPRQSTHRYNYICVLEEAWCWMGGDVGGGGGGEGAHNIGFFHRPSPPMTNHVADSSDERLRKQSFQRGCFSSLTQDVTDGLCNWRIPTFSLASQTEQAHESLKRIQAVSTNIWLFVSLSGCLAVHPSVVCLSVCVCLSVFLSVSVSLCLCLSLFLSVCLSVHIKIMMPCTLSKYYSVA